MALRPCLMVGVGGSGGKTLRFLRSHLLRHLQAHGIDEIPQAWQMLYVDVPTDQEGGGEETQDGLPPKLPDRDYLGLVNDGDIRYGTVDQAVVSSNTVEALVGWRPAPDEVNVPIFKGAGQYRTVGRMISLYALRQISEAVTRSVSQLTSGEVHAELADVSRKLGFATPQLTGPDDTWVYVITSLAGGTGSGVFLDVCDVIRSSAGGAAWTDESIGIMYTGEVFGELRPSERAGVNANSLACLSEVMAGYWREKPSVASQHAFEGPGLYPPARSGPRYPFLVGASNEEGVVTGKQVEIYGVVGNALASFLTSPNLQNGMAAYTMTNWNQKATANLFQSPLLRQNSDEQPFTALGVARLSLGRDRFADYAIDRLSRSTVDHLLEGHLANANLQETTPYEVVDRRAGDLLQSFLRQVYLNERSEQHNDVIDSLRPEGHAHRLQEIRGSISSNIQQQDPTSGRDWEQVILAQLRDHRGRLIDDNGVLTGQEAAELRSQAVDWSGLFQRRFVNTTSEYIASQGLAVTHRLIGLVREELATVADELKKESTTLKEHYLQVQRILAGELHGISRRVRANHDQVEGAVLAGVECLRQGAESQVRDQAAELLIDLSDQFAKPLGDAVDHARQALQLQARNTNALRGPIVSSWPGTGAVPDAYGPRHNEFLLESHSHFSKVFTSMLKVTVSAANDAVALQDSINSVVTGVPVDDLSRQRTAEADGRLPLEESVEFGVGAGQSLMTISEEWVPRSSNFRPDISVPATARFAIALDTGDEIQARATRFVHDPDMAIGRFVRESLRDYIEDNDAAPKERDARLERFKDRFRQLVRSSAPLVNINAAARTLAHPRAQQFGGSVRTFSMIPFSDPDSPSYQAVKEEDAAQGLGIDQDSFQESDAASISVFSFLSAPMQPHVFSSVIEPIMADWLQCQGRLKAGEPDPIGTFWKLRRSRGLIDFTPLPGASRRAVCRGWFIGKILGLIQVADGSQPKISVWDTNAVRWGSLPQPLLGGPIRNNFDELPRVLESFPIALISQGRAGAEARPIAPYERLASWGWDPSYQPGQLEYLSVGGPLATWIKDGCTEQGAPEPDPALAGIASSSVDERLAVCLATLEGAAHAYKAESTAVTRVNHQLPHQFFGLSPIAELAEDLAVIFDELIAAVGKLKSTTKLPTI